jgi:hypothetical protein
MEYSYSSPFDIVVAVTFSCFVGLDVGCDVTLDGWDVGTDEGVIERLGSFDASTYRSGLGTGLCNVGADVEDGKNGWIGSFMASVGSLVVLWTTEGAKEGDDECEIEGDDEGNDVGKDECDDEGNDECDNEGNDEGNTEGDIDTIDEGGDDGIKDGFWVVTIGLMVGIWDGNDDDSEGDIDVDGDVDVDGDIDGDVDGNIDGDVDGDVDRNVDGDVVKNVEGDTVETLEGDIVKNAEGDVVEIIEGNVDNVDDGSILGGVKEVVNSFVLSLVLKFVLAFALASFAFAFVGWINAMNIIIMNRTALYLNAFCSENTIFPMLL